VAYDTVANIVSDAAVELGLGTVSDVYASTDPNVVQLRTLLKSLGRDLVDGFQWPHLLSEATITTHDNWEASTAYVIGDVVTNGLYYYTCDTNGTSASSGGPTGTGTNITDGTTRWDYTGLAASFSLPTDFGSMIDQSFWNRTNTMPVGGPLSAQEWQYLKARATGVVFTVLFRPYQNTIQLYPDTDTPGGYDLYYQYRSTYWVAVTGSTTPTKSAPTVNSDVILFDPNLVMRGLKLAFLRAKGFDSQAAKEDFDATYDSATGNAISSPVLSIGPGRLGYPLLGYNNMPDTGFGS